MLVGIATARVGYNRAVWGHRRSLTVVVLGIPCAGDQEVPSASWDIPERFDGRRDMLISYSTLREGSGIGGIGLRCGHKGSLLLNSHTIGFDWLLLGLDATV